MEVYIGSHWRKEVRKNNKKTMQWIELNILWELVGMQKREIKLFKNYKNGVWICIFVNYFTSVHTFCMMLNIAYNYIFCIVLCSQKIQKNTEILMQKIIEVKLKNYQIRKIESAILLLTAFYCFVLRRLW